MATLATLFHLAKEHGWEEPIPAQIEELNKRHFLIGNVGGKCLIAEMVPNQVVSGQILSLQTDHAFKMRYSNQAIWMQDTNGKPRKGRSGRPGWITRSAANMTESILYRVRRRSCRMDF